MRRQHTHTHTHTHTGDEVVCVWLVERDDNVVTVDARVHFVCLSGRFSRRQHPTAAAAAAAAGQAPSASTRNTFGRFQRDSVTAFSLGNDSRSTRKSPHACRRAPRSASAFEEIDRRLRACSDRCSFAALIGATMMKLRAT